VEKKKKANEERILFKKLRDLLSQILFKQQKIWAEKMAGLLEVGKSDAGSQEESGCESLKNVCSRREGSACTNPESFRTSQRELSMGRARSEEREFVGGEEANFLDRKGKSDIR